MNVESLYLSVSNSGLTFRFLTVALLGLKVGCGLMAIDYSNVVEAGDFLVSSESPSVTETSDDAYEGATSLKIHGESNVVSAAISVTPVGQAAVSFWARAKAGTTATVSMEWATSRYRTLEVTSEWTKLEFAAQEHNEIVEFTFSLESEDAESPVVYVDHFERHLGFVFLDESIGGYIERIPNKPAYRAGETVIFSAKPDNGYEFVSWLTTPSRDFDESFQSFAIAAERNLNLRAEFMHKVELDKINVLRPLDELPFLVIDGAGPNGETVYQVQRGDSPLVENSMFIDLFNLRLVTLRLGSSDGETPNVSVVGSGYLDVSVDVVDDVEGWTFVTVLIEESLDQVGLRFSRNAVFFDVETVDASVLRVSTIGDGSVESEPAGAIDSVVDPGSLVTLTASPDSEWTFVRWKGDVESTSSSIQVVASGIQDLEAVFARRVDTSGVEWRFWGDTDVLSWSSGDGGEPVELAFESNGSYSRVNFELELEGPGRFEFDLDNLENEHEMSIGLDWPNGFDDQEKENGIRSFALEVPSGVWKYTGTLQTHFQNEIGSKHYLRNNRWSPGYPYQVTVPDGVGSVSIDPPQERFAAGASIELTAIPEHGYRFSHWGGSFSSTRNPLRITAFDTYTFIPYFIQETELFGSTWFSGGEFDSKYQTYPGTVSGSAFVAMSSFSSPKLTVESEIEGPSSIVFRHQSNDAFYGKIEVYVNGDRFGIGFSSEEEWAEEIVYANDLMNKLEFVSSSSLGKGKSIAVEIIGVYPHVSLEADIGGTVSVLNEKSRYDLGDEVVIVAEVDELYRFVGWEGDLQPYGDQTEIALTLNKGLKAKALFAPEIPIDGLSFSAVGASSESIQLSEGTENQYDVGFVVDKTVEKSELVFEFSAAGEISAKISDLFALSGGDFEVHVNDERQMDIEERLQRYSGRLVVAAEVDDVLKISWNSNGDESRELAGVLEELSFTQGYVVEFEAEGGNVSLIPNKSIYDPGELVMITAIPSPGNEFVAWSGFLSGTEIEQEVVIDRHLRFKAVFDVGLMAFAETFPIRFGGSGFNLFEGGSALRISRDDEESASGFIEIDVEGPASISYWFEYGNCAEPEYFSFFLDGEDVGFENCIRNQGFQQYIPAGDHVVRWEFSIPDGEVENFYIESFRRRENVFIYDHVFGITGASGFVDSEPNFAVPVGDSMRFTLDEVLSSDHYFTSITREVADENGRHGRESLIASPTRSFEFEPLASEHLRLEVLPTFLYRGYRIGTYNSLVSEIVTIGSDNLPDAFEEDQSSIRFAMDSTSSRIVLPSSGPNIVSFWARVPVGVTWTLNDVEPVSDSDSSGVIYRDVFIEGNGEWTKFVLALGEGFGALDIDLRIEDNDGSLEPAGELVGLDVVDGFGVSYIHSPAGRVETSDARLSYDYGESFLLTASDDDEHPFNQWSETAGDLPPAVEIVAGDGTFLRPTWGESFVFQDAGFRLRGEIPKIDQSWTPDDYIELSTNEGKDTEFFKTVEGPAVVWLTYSGLNSKTIDGESGAEIENHYLEVKVGDETSRIFDTNNGIGYSKDGYWKRFHFEVPEGAHDVSISHITNIEHSDSHARIQELKVLPGYAIELNQFGVGSLMIAPDKDAYESGESVTIAAVVLKDQGWSGGDRHRFNGWNGTVESEEQLVTFNVDRHHEILGKFARIKVLGGIQWDHMTLVDEIYNRIEFFEAKLLGPGVLVVHFDGNHSIYGIKVGGVPIFEGRNLYNNDVYEIPIPGGENKVELKSSSNFDSDNGFEFHEGYGLFLDSSGVDVQIEPDLSSYPLGTEVTLSVSENFIDEFGGSMTWDGDLNSHDREVSIVMDGHKQIALSVVSTLEWNGRMYRTGSPYWKVDPDESLNRIVPGVYKGRGSGWIESDFSGPGALNYSTTEGTSSGGVLGLSIDGVAIETIGPNESKKTPLPDGDRHTFRWEAYNSLISISDLTIDDEIGDPYENWKRLWFSPLDYLDPGVSGDGVDYDRDGIVTEMEYQLGTSPVSRDSFLSIDHSFDGVNSDAILIASIDQDISVQQVEVLYSTGRDETHNWESVWLSEIDYFLFSPQSGYREFQIPVSQFGGKLGSIQFRLRIHVLSE